MVCCKGDSLIICKTCKSPITYGEEVIKKKEFNVMSLPSP